MFLVLVVVVVAVSSVVVVIDFVDSIAYPPFKIWDWLVVIFVELVYGVVEWELCLVGLVLVEVLFLVEGVVCLVELVAWVVEWVLWLVVCLVVLVDWVVSLVPDFVEEGESVEQDPDSAILRIQSL